MAEETIDKAIEAGILGKRKCITSDLKLTRLSDNISAGRLHIYGEGSSDIKKMIDESPSLGTPIDPRLPYTRAEIIWICRNEMPLTVEDILARRTRSLLLNARASAEIAPAVASIMAEEFKYDKNWQQEQIVSYNKLIDRYL